MNDTPKRAQSDFVFLALLLFYASYACAFIYRTSFVVGGERYFVLLDDEMISMRYAANLAHGHGLVWNPGGDRVEGFTNTLPGAALWESFLPGHLKWDYYYSIAEMKPDLIVGTWLFWKTAEPYLASDYRVVSLNGSDLRVAWYLRKNSMHAHVPDALSTSAP